jgi:hypothetical protein
VNHWVVWMTSFLHIFWAAVDHIFWNHDVYLWANGENQPFVMIIVALEI